MKLQQNPSTPAVWAALITVYLVWGSTYLAIRYAVETLPPFLMGSVRFLIAGSVLYVWRRVLGDPAPSRLEWRSAAIIGLLLLLGGNGGVVWAQQWVPSGLTALIVSTVPIWMVLMDALRPGGRWPRWPASAAAVIGLAGVGLLIRPGSAAEEAVHVDPIGAMVLILATVFWSVGSLYNRNATLPSSPLLGTAMQMLGGGCGLLLAGLAAGEWGRFSLEAVTARSLWGLAYLIVFGSWFGFAAYVWLLRVAPTPLVSTYAYVNPLVAILLGYFVASEPITPRILLATAIIVGSVALTTISQTRPFESHEDRPEASRVRKG